MEGHLRRGRFTALRVALLLTAFIRRHRALAWSGAVLCPAYFTFGIMQRERAEPFARQLAGSRGHQPRALAVRGKDVPDHP